VQRAGQRGQPGGQGVVEVGAHRGGDAHGHGRGRELVVRQEDEGGVDGGGRDHGRGREAGGEARRDGRAGAFAGCGGLPDDVGECGRAAARRARGGRGAQVGAEGVGGPAHDQRPAHAVERAGERAGAEVGRGPVTAIRLPQELGHLFERRAGGQVGGEPAAVDGAELLVELGDARCDGGEPGRCLAAAPAACGEALDVGQVEEAAAPDRVAVGFEQAAADVGVQRRGLDAKPAGRLLGREHAVHPWQSTLT
jgi:hypothetical protein